MESIKKWVDSLTGWHWWAYQIIGGVIGFTILELIFNLVGYSVLPWRWI